jgi:Domain of unknown function (DUF4114)/PEP-CTERM motif
MRSQRIRRAFKGLILSLFVFLIAAEARANLTTIDTESLASEVSLITTAEGAKNSLSFGGYVYASPTSTQIVEASATATPTSLMDYLYGAGHFTQVDDLYDQLWRHGPGGSSSIILEARYAGFHQNQLGVDPFPQSSISQLTQQFSRLASITGTGLNARFTSINNTYAHVLSNNQIEIFRTDTTITSSLHGGTVRTTYKGLEDPFSWLIKAPEATPNIWSTLVSQNVDQIDHAVTFRVNRNGQTHYVVAFEDMRSGGADLDYNDVVFEVSSTPIAPEPSSLMIAGLGALGLLGYWKLRRGGQ